MELEIEAQLLKILHMYGGQEEFLVKFSYENIIHKIVKNEEQAYLTTKAPSLHLLELTYGHSFVNHWISLQLEQINQSIGKNQRLEVIEIKNLSKSIYLKYPKMNVCEFLLFIFRQKTGDFGEFFGTITENKLMTSLSEFMIERNKILTEHRLKAEKQNRILERQEWYANGVSREEYLRMLQEGRYKPRLGNSDTNNQNNK